MTLDELLAALERIGDGDWQILDVRPAEEAEGSGQPGVGAAPPEPNDHAPPAPETASKNRGQAGCEYLAPDQLGR